MLEVKMLGRILWSAIIGVASLAGCAPAISEEGQELERSIGEGDDGSAVDARESAVADLLARPLETRIDVSSYSKHKSTVLTEAITLKTGGYLRLELEVTLEELAAHREVPGIVIDVTGAKMALARSAELAEERIATSAAAIARRVVEPEATFCEDRAVVTLETPVTWAGASWPRAVGISRLLVSLDEDTGGDGGCPIFSWHSNCSPATECNFLDSILDADGFCFGGALVFLCGCYPKVGL
jgi:hypothetical protein